MSILACNRDKYYNYCMMNIFAQLLDLIYKKRCYFCRSTHESLVMCSKCYDEMDILPPNPILEIEGCNTYSASVYGKNVQKLIRGVKYHNQYELAYFQAKLMYDFWQTVDNKKEKYTVMPVPLHKCREKKRGYNHMMLVAKEFARLCDYEMKDDIAKRVKDTKAQYKLTAQERQKNMHNAFKVDKTKYNGENFLIIDDILTSGSTLAELIREMQKEDISSLTCFTTSCTSSHV